jgi:hypothetical protein
VKRTILFVTCGWIVGLLIGAGVMGVLVASHYQRKELVVAEQTKEITERTCAAMYSQMMDDWLTVLYEPGPAPATAPLELLNMVRPGLGTVLAKLQAQQSPQGLSVRWVLSGNVKVINGPQNSATGMVRISSIRDGWIAAPVPGQRLPTSQ